MYLRTKTGAGKRVVSAMLGLSLLSTMLPAGLLSINARAVESVDYANGATDPQHGAAPSFAGSGVTEIVNLYAQNGIAHVVINNTGASPLDYYAVVVDADKASGIVTKLDPSNYNNPTVILDGHGVEVKDLGNGQHVLSVLVDKVKISESGYHRQYTMIVYTNGKTGSMENYAVNNFWVDSEGNSISRDNSYMLTFANNDGTQNGGNSAVESTIGANPVQQPPQITLNDASGNAKATTIAAAQIKRPGYELLGWDTDANKVKEIGTPNEQAAATVTAEVSLGGNYTPASVANNTIYNLNALWKPIQVTYTAVEQGSVTPKVNAAYQYKAVIQGATDTDKLVKQKYQVGDLVGDHVITAADLLPNGLSGATLYGTSTEARAIITGTPTESTDTARTVVMVVTDQKNNTEVEFEVTIPAVQKGDVPMPRLDSNTGLQAFGVTENADWTGENDTEHEQYNSDGSILGFFPAINLDGVTPLPSGKVYAYRQQLTAAEGDTPATYTKWKYVSNADGEISVSETNPDTGVTDTNEGDVSAPGTAEDFKLVQTTGLESLNGYTYNTVDAYQLSGLPKGIYEIKYAQTKDLGESKPVILTIGVGDSMTVNQPGTSFLFNLAGGELVLGDVDQDLANTTDENGAVTVYNKYAERYDGLVANVKIRIPHTKPTRSGYVFSGWTTGELDEGTGDLEVLKYAEGATDDLYYTIGTQSVSLAALWTKASTDGKATVTFNLAGGKKPLDSAARTKYEAFETSVTEVEIPENTDATEIVFNADITPVREGYTFEGWYDQENGKLYKVDAGTAEADRTITMNTNYSLAAVWNKGGSAASNEEPGLHYDLMGGSKPADATKFNAFFDAYPDAATGTTIDFTTDDAKGAIPELYGYQFAGWQIKGTTVEVKYNAETSAFDPTEYKMTADSCTLIAQWQADDSVDTSRGAYIRFLPMGGALDDEAMAAIQTLNNGIQTFHAEITEMTPTIAAEIKPVKGGAAFQYWTDGMNHYLPGDTITVKKGDYLVLHASYIDDGVYNLSFNLTGGAIADADRTAWADFLKETNETLLQAQNRGLNTPVEIAFPAAIPTRPGMTFGGWTVGSDVYAYDAAAETPGYVSGKEKIEVKGDMQLAALWNGGGAVGLQFSLAGGQMSDTLYDPAPTEEGAPKSDAEAWEAFLKTIEGKTTGDKVAIPNIKPVRQGMKFLGWGEDDKLETEGYKLYNYSDIADAPQSFIEIGDKGTILSAIWGASTESFGAITYYDWDGTLLGSSIVALSDTEDQMEATISAFAKTLMAPTQEEVDADKGVGGKYENYTGKVADEMGYAEDAAKPLTYKAGYKFKNVWLDNSSDAFECYLMDGDSAANYPNGVPAKHVESVSAYTAKERLTASEIKNRLADAGVISLKAAYEAQSNLNEGTSNKSYYVLTSASYNRYGSASKTAGTYGITFEFKRQNIQGNPVARLRDPMVMLSTTPEGAKTVVAQVVINNGDIMKSEVTVHRLTETAQLSVSDIYGLATWTTAAPMSSALVAVNKTGTANDSFVLYGTRRYISDLTWDAVNGAITSTIYNQNINAQTMADAGLTYTSITAARNNLKAAVTAMKNADDIRTLTFEELQAAINTGSIS